MVVSSAKRRHGISGDREHNSSGEAVARHAARKAAARLLAAGLDPTTPRAGR
ncbi:MFS transporter, partial [Mesorhizobium sp. M0644]